MRPICCFYILVFCPVYIISTLTPFALASTAPRSPSSPVTFPRPSARKARCLRFRENDVLRDMCPAFQQSDLDSFQALFPDVSILSGLGHDADFNLLYGSQPFYESNRHDRIPIQSDDHEEPATHTGDHADVKAATYTSHQQQQTSPESMPASSSKAYDDDTSSSVTKGGEGGPLFSYREWEQKHTPSKENDRRSSKKRAPGKPGIMTGGGGGANGGGNTGNGRQMVDSVDGVFADDFGSMFEAATQGESPAAANVYKENEYIEPSRSGAPSKLADLPIKSFKERFNYASIDCAATVRGANKEARGAQSILYESKDQYMLSKCSADKYVIINLCEEILIDTIVMANFEFFSSTFKDFRVYVADQYPTNDWKFLGQWQARNTRDLQVFKVTNRIGWFENIKIEFLTHYGHEYYCPLSLVRVHGMPMWEYYNLIESRDLSGDLDEDALMERYLWPSEVRDEIIHPKIEPSKDTPPMPENREDDRHLQVPIIPPIPDDQVVQSVQYDDPTPLQSSSSAVVVRPEENTGAIDSRAHTKTDSVPIMVHSSTADIPVITDGPVIPPIEPDPAHIEQEILSIILDPVGTLAPEVQEEEEDGERAVEERSKQQETASISLPTLDGPEEGVRFDEANQSSGTDNVPTTAVPNVERQQQPSTAELPGTSTFIGPLPSTSETATAAAPPPPPPPPPSPGPDDVAARAITIPKMPHKDGNTQESIYKTIMKRLNALEANATLSQRYLDEQNQILNDVLRNMEKRHQDQLIALLGRLNDTASSRIDNMRRRYEQLYDELKYESENRAREMEGKLTHLADQIAFERRVSMAQLVIVLTLFVFVALSRGTLSILSPIMEAQAQERKRRESADTLAPSPSSSEKPKDAPPAILATPVSSPASPPTDEDDEEHTARDFCTRRRSSSAEPLRRWDNEDESMSSPEPTHAAIPENSDSSRRRRLSSVGDGRTIPVS